MVRLFRMRHRERSLYETEILPVAGGSAVCRDAAVDRAARFGGGKYLCAYRQPFSGYPGGGGIPAGLYRPADGAKYNHWYGAVNGSYTYSWCQTFLSWCAEQAEIGTDVFPKAVSVASAYAAFAGQKRYQKSAAQGGSYTPRAGDVAFYSENGDADALSHVGLVTGTADGTLYTIEGNVSNQVQRCERQLDSVQIIGYGCPMYADLPNQIVPEAPVVTVDPGTSEYRTKIDWAECADAQRYLVVLWDSAGKELVRQESTDCYYYDYLTEGNYTVQVSACNGENYADSERWRSVWRSILSPVGSTSRC